MSTIKVRNIKHDSAASDNIALNSDGTTSITSLSNIVVQGREVIDSNSRFGNGEGLPTVKPSLLLDFANAKSLHPKIVFARNSSATLFDGKTFVQGNENQMRYTNDMTNSYWSRDRHFISAGHPGPDGSATSAYKLTQSSATDDSGYFGRLTFYYKPGTYTWSGYFKKGDGQGQFVRMDTRADDTYSTWFDIVNGTVATQDAGHTSATIVDVGNDWYRCSVTATHAASSNSQLLFYFSKSDGTNVIDTSQVSGYFYGLQYNEGSTAGPYIETGTNQYRERLHKMSTVGINIPRFDHDPATKESLGLLVEPSAINYIWNSSDSSYSNHNSSGYHGVDTKNDAYGLDGTRSAVSFLTTNATSDRMSFRYFIPGGNYPTDTTMCMSCYVKMAGESNYLVAIETASYSTWVNPGSATFNLRTGEKVLVEGGGVDADLAGIQEVGNGWYRIWIVANTESINTSASGFYINIKDANNQHLTSSTTEPLKGVYIWGPQSEAGLAPTSFISGTASSSVSRTTDYPVFNDINQWVAWQDGASFVTKYSTGTDVSARNGYVAMISAGGAPKVLIGAHDTGGLANRIAIREGWGYSVGLSEVPTFTGTQTIAARILTGDVAAYANGVSLGTDTDCDIEQDYVNMVIGASSQNNEVLNGHIQKMAFYSTALTDSELKVLTEV